MDCRMPGFLVLHYFPEFAQAHVHWVNDGIQPSHSLLLPSLALNLSQHQSLFQWVGSSHSGGRSFTLASVLPMNIQGWFPLGLSDLISLLPRDSQKSSPALQFKSIILQCSVLFMVQLSHPHMTTGKTIALTLQTFVSQVISLLFSMLSRFVIAFLAWNKVFSLCSYW